MKNQQKKIEPVTVADIEHMHKVLNTHPIQQVETPKELYEKFTKKD